MDAHGPTPQLKRYFCGLRTHLRERWWTAMDVSELTTDQKVGGSNPFGRAHLPMRYARE